MNTEFTEIKEEEREEVVTKGFLVDYLDHKFALYSEEQHRKIMALMEDNQHKFQQMIESFNMRTEAFLRYIDGNEEDKEKINRRLDRLESKVLLA